jgi:uncharacterized membrane protein YgaE (UPF0421/DUF939 family)
MSGIEKYTPRNVRVQRAYRLALGGATAGGVGVIALVLAIAGVIGYTLPVIALIIAAVCMASFRGMTRTR